MFNLDTQKLGRRAWLKVAGIPDHRLGWELQDCRDVDYETITTLKSWLSAIKEGNVIKSSGSPLCGKGILVYGKPGHGKTTLALSTIQDAMRTLPLNSFKVKPDHVLVRPCYFITFNDVLNLKGKLISNEGSEAEEILYSGILGECADDAFNIRILIIDDLGQEHASLSGWQKSMLHHILRTRYNNGLPTIVTTNVARKDWGKLYGDATESFSHEAFIYLPIDDAADLRK